MPALESLHVTGRGYGVDEHASWTSSAVLPGIDQDTIDSLPSSLHMYTGVPSGIYEKTAAGAGVDKWRLLGAVEAGGLSWREVVNVKDDTEYADLAAALAAVNTGIIDDEIAVIDGMRILFPNIVGQSKNVWIVGGTPPAATLTEDENTPTVGDIVVITEGTSAGKQYRFDGEAWVINTQSILDEIALIRQFIGKGAVGEEAPSYISQTVVSDGDSTELSIGNLDAALAAITTALAAAVELLDRAQTEGTVAGVSTLQSVDAVNVDEVLDVEWHVRVSQGSNFKTWKVLASHNGTPSTDATDRDRARYGRRKVGIIPGVKVNVSLSGAGAAQVMSLDVEATSAVDVKWVRKVIAAV